MSLWNLLLVNEEDNLLFLDIQISRPNYMEKMSVYYTRALIYALELNFRDKKFMDQVYDVIFIY